MSITPTLAKRVGTRRAPTIFITLATAVLWVVGAPEAWAYMGRSFLQVPGVSGNWKGEQYKGWVSLESNMWKSSASAGMGGAPRRRKDFAIFTYPVAPRSGASTLTVAVDKHNPALSQLMDRCAKKTTIPEMEYAESSDRNRAILEIGARPADIPEYYEYKLKNVQITDCPVVADAAEQALVLSFSDIEWLNFHAQGEGEMINLQPALLPPAQASGKTRNFVVSWFAPAQDVSDDQCPVVSDKPLEAEYYQYMTKEEAAKERERLAPKGGPTYPDGVICMRGPHQLDACKLPGIVKDPVQPEPQTKMARGIDLDGNNGTGPLPGGICKHKNYVSDDGRTGIDNQMYTVEGCMRGYMGHKGQLYQYANEQRRNGQLSIMVEVSGIDNDQNDDSVDVTFFYSLDSMEKNAAGTYVLPNFTFRVSDKPQLQYYFTRMHGRIVNGIITTDPVKVMRTNIPLDIPIELHQAQVRLQIMPDGTLKGVLGGYQDWRRIANSMNHSQQESLIGTSTTAMYSALKRAADGGKDPVTGECNEISSAYDIEGTPAFLPPEQQARLQAGTATLSENRK